MFLARKCLKFHDESLGAKHKSIRCNLDLKTTPFTKKCNLYFWPWIFLSLALRVCGAGPGRAGVCRAGVGRAGVGRAGVGRAVVYAHWFKSKSNDAKKAAKL